MWFFQSWHPGESRLRGMVRCVTFDQCRYGLRHPNGQPMKKRTRLMTNIKHVVFEFSHKDCVCTIKHAKISGFYNGEVVSKFSQWYPDAMAVALARAAYDSLEWWEKRKYACVFVAVVDVFTYFLLGHHSSCPAFNQFYNRVWRFETSLCGKQCGVRKQNI